MRQATAAFFVFLILLQGLSSLLTVAVFHFQRDRIAQELCVNRFDAIPICRGQCVLDRQLQENDKREREVPISTNQKSVYCCDQRQHVLPIIRPLAVRSNYHQSDLSFIYAEFLPAIYTPPEPAVITV